MRPLIRSRVTNAATAAQVAGVSGAVATVAIVLFLALGSPWGSLNDLLLAVMGVAIAPMMLGSYELGGVTPLWPARLSLASGIAACLVYAALQFVFFLGFVSFDYSVASSGALAVQDLALIVIGLWLTGAPLLAGPWLPGPLRLLGAASGVGFVLTGAGLLAGGMTSPLTYVGGLGFQFLFPIWALLMSRVFRARAAAP